MPEQTTKSAPTPIEDAVRAVVNDPVLNSTAKPRKIAAARALGCIEAAKKLLPYTFTRKIKAGTIAVTVRSVDNLINGRAVDGAVGVRISATLNDEPLDIDPDREFLNPPLRFITPDGENETVIPDSVGLGGRINPGYTYRWREDPVAGIIQNITDQIRGELETKRAR